MMIFLEQQYISFENVLSYRTRTDISRLDELLIFTKNNADALDLELTGNILFTVYERIKENDKYILGVEILMPVNKHFDSFGQYVCKQRFRLVNAVSARFCGFVSDIEEMSTSLSEYLKSNDLRAISNVYYVAADDYGISPRRFILDAYVSVDGNLL